MLSMESNVPPDQDDEHGQNMTYYSQICELKILAMAKAPVEGSWLLLSMFFRKDQSWPLQFVNNKLHVSWKSDFCAV